MKKTIALLIGMISSVLFLSTGTAMAADGSSGCGPGWYLLKENSLVSSSLRATTNGVLMPVVTVGMTVGTSNCTQHKIVMTEKESLHFATMNYYELMGEAARGEGVYLSAFSDTIGCPKAARAEFGRKIQGQYRQVFSDGQRRPEQMLESVYKVILQDSSLVRACSLG
ncbi:MAG: DUF3015 family protein [Bdellovibrionaceae bacterium]|nr:DUF3015 family protein [Pseudobdellovibrionaceae bacterium]MBX3034841.1 DUF3015 family protein [Pseudobdellovibrionaceae bacterium]